MFCCKRNDACGKKMTTAVAIIHWWKKESAVQKKSWLALFIYFCIWTPKHIRSALLNIFLTHLKVLLKIFHIGGSSSPSLHSHILPLHFNTGLTFPSRRMARWSTACWETPTVWSPRLAGWRILGNGRSRASPEKRWWGAAWSSGSSPARSRRTKVRSFLWESLTEIVEPLRTHPSYCMSRQLDFFHCQSVPEQPLHPYTPVPCWLSLSAQASWMNGWMLWKFWCSIFCGSSSLGLYLDSDSLFHLVANNRLYTFVYRSGNKQTLSMSIPALCLSSPIFIFFMYPKIWAQISLQFFSLFPFYFHFHLFFWSYSESCFTS